MSLLHTTRAMGAATKLLADTISELTTTVVHVGQPNHTTISSAAHYCLFLYEAAELGDMRSVSLFEGQPAPLWLGARYLLTALDMSGRSDSLEALRLLGDGLRALQQDAFLDIARLPASSDDYAALLPNPEPLKVTLIDPPAELAGKLVNRAEDTYHFSMALELRPVLIARDARADHAPLVGVDYDAGGLAADPVGLDVSAALGPVLSSLEPNATDLPRSGPAGTPPVTAPRIAVTGRDLHGGLSVQLGDITLPLVDVVGDDAAFVLEPALVNGSTVSAGTHAVCATQTLSTGRVRRSNPLLFDLIPQLTAVTAAVTAVAGTAVYEGHLELAGTLLGTDTDDVVVSLYRDDSSVASFYDITDVSPVGAEQTRVRVAIAPQANVEAGTYRVIVSVNNRQARSGPEVTLP